MNSNEIYGAPRAGTANSAGPDQWHIFFRPYQTYFKAFTYTKHIASSVFWFHDDPDD